MAIVWDLQELNLLSLTVEIIQELPDLSHVRHIRLEGAQISEEVKLALLARIQTHAIQEIPE